MLDYIISRVISNREDFVLLLAIRGVIEDKLEKCMLDDWTTHYAMDLSLIVGVHSLSN